MNDSHAMKWDEMSEWIDELINELMDGLMN